MKNTIELFDTLSSKKEKIERSRKPLKLFVCGPTVYDYLHIGNARTYITFDAFVKFLRSQKIKVEYLQNITDIDDKIIVKAREGKTSPKAVAAKFQKVYFKNMKELGISSVDTCAPATKFIPEIVAQVQTLIKKGYVYKIENDGYYFDITKFKDYGKLSHRTALQAEDGVSRIDESINKRNKGDFCVWKYTKSAPSPKGSGNTKALMQMIGDEPAWNTSLGWGRPGWHIEDTAISEHFFGPQYDIHGGGVDLKFPHHEAEIALEESASDKKPFVKIWMHVGALTMSGKKMSKSLGNVVSIDDFLKLYDPNVLRLMALTHHYRSPLNYTKLLAEQNKKSWESILTFLGKLKFVAAHAITKKLVTNDYQLMTHFVDALSDDFNTPKALAALFDYIGKTQEHVYLLSKKEARDAIKITLEALSILGFTPTLPKIPLKINAILKKREEYRRYKQFTQADASRKQLDGLGYVIEDTPLGQFVWPRG